MSARRAGSFVVLSLVMVLAPLAPVGPAWASSTTATDGVEVLLAGGVGDHGPAVDARIEAANVAVAPDGALIVADQRSHNIRRVDPVTGVVDSLYGLPFNPRGENPPSAPWPADGTDVRSVRLPDITKIWVTDDGDTWVRFNGQNRSIYRIAHATGTIRRWVADYDFGPWRTDPRLVRADGSVVLGWRGYEPSTSTNLVSETRLMPPSADPPTEMTTLLSHAPGGLTESASGVLFEARAGGIWRVDGVDQQTLVAGVDGPGAAPMTLRTEGAPALGAVMAPADLLSAPNGDLVYSETVEVSPDFAPRTLYRSLSVGGSVHTVAGPFGTSSGFEHPTCGAGDERLAIEGANLLTACWGMLRSWPLDGSKSTEIGVIRAGIDSSVDRSSPDGAALDTAFLEGPNGLADDPAHGSVVATTPTAVLELVPGAGGHVSRLTHETVRPGAGLAIEADGTVLITDHVQADDTWRILAVDRAGSVHVIAGGGDLPLARGRNATAVKLVDFSFNAVRLALLDGGGTLAMGPIAGVVWGLDLTDGTFSELVGGGASPFVDGMLASGAQLDVQSMGSAQAGQLVLDATSGSTRSLFRVDSTGRLHRQAGPVGLWTYALMADQSLVVDYGSSILRFGVDGSVLTLAGWSSSFAGSYVIGEGLVPGALYAGAGDSLLVASDTKPTTRLLRVGTSVHAWSGAVPTVSAVSSPDGTVQVTATGGPTATATHVRVSLSTDSSQGMWAGSFSYGDMTLPAAGGTDSVGLFRDTGEGDLVPGTLYHLTAWVWSAEQPSGAPPVHLDVMHWADGTAPTATVTAPVSSVVLGTSIGVGWKGSDAGSGVATYEVRYRSAATRRAMSDYVYPAAWQHTTATSAAMSRATATEYCFSVRATDKAGNVSAWSAERCSSAPFDDRLLLVSTGSVQRLTTTRAWAGTVTRSTAKDTRLVRADLTANRVGVVATRCPTCGAVKVYLDGHYLGTADFKGPSAFQATVWLPVSTVRSGTLMLKTTSSARLDLDGIVIRR